VPATCGCTTSTPRASCTPSGRPHSVHGRNCPKRSCLNCCPRPTALAARLSRRRFLGPGSTSRRLMNTARCDGRGFVLVAVLVALVVITLLASAVAVVSGRAVAETQAEIDAFQAEIAEIGTRDTLLYLLSTQRQTYAGLTVDQQQVTTSGLATIARSQADDFGDVFSPLPVGNEIRLDGTSYAGLGDIRFALQDDAGRLSPNWSPPLYRPGFYSLLRIPVQQ